VLEKALDKKKKEKPHLKVSEELPRLTLKGLHPTLWPKGAAGDELLQQVEKQKERSVAKPFPYVDLRHYLPTWCAEGRKQDEEDTDTEPNDTAMHLAKALGVQTKRAKPHLTLLQWCAAFDRYAVAAAVAGVWDYTCALKHKDNCLKLTEEARAKGTKGAVGMAYDVLARKQWAEYAYSAVDGFEVNASSLKLDAALVAQAENDAQQSGKGSGKGGKGSDGSGKGYQGKGHDWNRSRDWSSRDSWGDNDSAGEKRKLPWNKGYSDQKRQRWPRQVTSHHK
jgi:hypothetical protein